MLCAVEWSREYLYVLFPLFFLRKLPNYFYEEVKGLINQTEAPRLIPYNDDIFFLSPSKSSSLLSIDFRQSIVAEGHFLLITNQRFKYVNFRNQKLLSLLISNVIGNMGNITHTFD